KSAGNKMGLPRSDPALGALPHEQCCCEAKGGWTPNPIDRVYPRPRAPLAASGLVASAADVRAARPKERSTVKSACTTVVQARRVRSPVRHLERSSAVCSGQMVPLRDTPCWGTDPGPVC